VTVRRIITITVAIVAVALLAGLASGCTKKAPKGAQSGGQTQAMQVVVVADPDVPEVAYALKPGQVLHVKTTGVTIGTIVSAEVTPALVAVPDSSGRLHAVPSPVAKEVRLVLDGTASTSGGAYFFPGGQLYVSADVELVTQVVDFMGSIVSIAPKSS
jgi:hypothetical protein